MLLSTMDHIPGQEVAEVLGLVRGYNMRGFATILSSFTDPARIRTMLGELKDITDGAVDDLVKHATEMEADAIIGLRFAANSYEYDNALKNVCMVYGTAVKLA